MSGCDCFIGVVSHEGSRFSDSQGPDGLAARLRRPLEAAGLQVLLKVNTADLYDSSPILDRRTVQASLTAQLALDAQWSRYVWGGWRASERRRIGARFVRRVMQAVRPPAVATMRRLVNIELSHLDLLRSAVEANARWALILEDDADNEEGQFDDLGAGLTGLVNREVSLRPSFVNLSRSFANDQLGITHLLRDTGVPWGGSYPRMVLSSQRPVTNTVCAILYEGAFLPRLLEALDAIPIEPILPIDWKLNKALLNLNSEGQLGEGDCWLIEPAPIVQRSMLPAGIMAR